MTFSRRTALQMVGASALAPAALPLEAAQIPAPPKESSGTPKIAIATGDTGLPGGRGTTPPVDPSAGPRRVKQLGVDHVLGGFGGVPWTEESLTKMMAPWKAEGVSVDNL